MLVTNTNDSGAGSLRAAIASATAGDTITFDPSLANQTIILTSGEIFVSPGKNLVIDGTAAPNLAISGNNSSRIFRFGSNIDFQSSHTIRNLILRNGVSSDRGGAVQTEDLGQLTVEGITFQDNVATNGGAAIWTNARSGGVTVLNSRFINNQATAGNDERGAGGIAFIGFGSGGSELIVRDSRFIGNQGINGAAINVINGRITIENSRFIANDTTAASFDTGQPRDFLRGYGGALYVDRVNDSLVIRNSVFEGNRGEGEGGAAYLFADPGDTVLIENTVFRNNQVVALTGGGNTGNGGAIAHVRNSLDPTGSFVIINGSFVDNIANNQGGGVWVNQTNSTIANTTFSGNQAPNNFGGAVTTYSPLAVTNVTIADNSAEFSGAIAQGSTNLVTATNTIFANNASNNTGVSFNGNQQTNRPMNNGGGNIQFPNGPELIPGILIVDPQLDPLQSINGTFVRPLQPGSPAVDAGVVVGSLLFDQRGAARPQDGDNNGSVLYDIGAFEVAGTLPPPTFLSIGDLVFEEEDRLVRFNVFRSGDLSTAVTVDFTTANGTATAGTDYTSVSGTLSFPANPIQNDSLGIEVPILEDGIVELNETFSVNLLNATGATILDPQGIGTITNDDTATALPAGVLTQASAKAFQVTEPVTLEFSLINEAGQGVSEIALFSVDDDQGSINGLLPGATGYLEAAIQRARTVFSVLDNPPSSPAEPRPLMTIRPPVSLALVGGNLQQKGFEPAPSNLAIAGENRFQFLLIEDGTLDAIRLGAQPSGSVFLPTGEIFSVAPNQDSLIGFGRGFNINWDTGRRQISMNLFAREPLTLDDPIRFPSNETQDDLQGELLDLRGIDVSGAYFITRREAAFDNTFGLYRLQNDQGAVKDPLTGDLLLPGDARYIEAALRNRLENIAQTAPDGDVDSILKTLPGNALYAPFIVADGTMEDAIAGAAPVYTPFLAANNGVDHVRMLANNTFGFEDLPGGGDFDYNDLVVELIFNVGG